MSIQPFYKITRERDFKVQPNPGVDYDAYDDPAQLFDTLVKAGVKLDELDFSENEDLDYIIFTIVDINTDEKEEVCILVNMIREDGTEAKDVACGIDENATTIDESYVFEREYIDTLKNLLKARLLRYAFVSTLKETKANGKLYARVIAW